MNSHGSAPQTARFHHWRRSLPIVATVFAIVLVLSSLLITLTLIHRSSPATPPVIVLPSPVPSHTPSPVSSRTPTAVQNIRMINSRTGWIFCIDGSVLHTTDSGLNWVDVTPSALLTFKQGHLGVGSLFLDNSTAWIVVLAVNSETSFSFHTSDAGQSWQEGTIQTHIVLATTAPTYDITAISAGEAWVISMNDGPPVSGSAPVMQLRRGDLFHTTDSGKSWRQIRNYPTASVGCPPALRFADQRTAIITGGIGTSPVRVAVYLTVDGGASWQSISVQSPDPAHWKLSMICSPQFFTATDGIFTASFQNATTQAASGVPNDQGFSIFSTHDGGHTWISSPILDVSNASCTSEKFSTNGKFFDIQHGYVLCRVGQTGHQRFYSTGDGGQHWQATDLNLPYQRVGNVVAADFISPQKGWALLASPEYSIAQPQPTSLYTTGDGGHTWTQVRAHFPIVG